MIAPIYKALGTLWIIPIYRQQPKKSLISRLTRQHGSTFAFSQKNGYVDVSAVNIATLFCDNKFTIYPSTKKHRNKDISHNFAFYLRGY